MKVVERPTQTETLQMFIELSPAPQWESREAARRAFSPSPLWGGQGGGGDKEMTRT
jgi:hypothetical protein